MFQRVKPTFGRRPILLCPGFCWGIAFVLKALKEIDKLLVTGSWQDLWGTDRCIPALIRIHTFLFPDPLVVTILLACAYLQMSK